MNVKFLKTYVYLFSKSAPNTPLNKNCHLSSVINSPPTLHQLSPILPPEKLPQLFGTFRNSSYLCPVKH